MNAIIDSFKAFWDSAPELSARYTSFVRILLPALSALILSGAFISLFTLPKQKELFAKFSLKDRNHVFPLNHLECLIGRSRSADIPLPSLTVSRIHAVISGDGEGNWQVYDMDSKQGTFVNNREVTDTLRRRAPTRLGRADLL